MGKEPRPLTALRRFEKFQIARLRKKGQRCRIERNKVCIPMGTDPECWKCQEEEEEE